MCACLVIGDGDFSFSAGLVSEPKPTGRRAASQWRTGIAASIQPSDLVATSFEAYQTVIAKYPRAVETIDRIRVSGATVLHEVDGTKLSSCLPLQGKTFDLIVFNFPHTGGKGKIGENRRLLLEFFLSAERFLKTEGEVRMLLCKGQGGTPRDCQERGYENSWKVVEMAAHAGLVLKEVEPFVVDNFPEYEPSGYRGTSRGFSLNGALNHVFSRPQLDGRKLWTCATEMVLFCEECCATYHCSSDAVEIPFHLQEVFQYPLLSQQPWHPIVQIRDMLLDSLKRSPLIHIPTADHPCRFWNRVEHQQLQVVRIHRTESLCMPSSKSGTLAAAITGLQESKEYSFHFSAYMDLPVLLKKAKDEMGVLHVVSSPVVQKNFSISLRPCDQPVTHEVIGAVSFGKILNNEAAALFEVYAFDVLKCILGCDVRLSKTCFPTEYFRACHSLLVPLRNEDTCIMQFGTVERREETFLVFVVFVEPLAMIAFGIEDVRLMWSKSTSFATQMQNFSGKPLKLPSLFPPVYVHDVSFWCKDQGSAREEELAEFNELELMNLMLKTGEGLSSVAEVTCIDKYNCLQKCLVSYCYRIVYCSCDQALSKSQAADMQLQLRSAIARLLKWSVR